MSFVCLRNAWKSTVSVIPAMAAVTRPRLKAICASAAEPFKGNTRLLLASASVPLLLAGGAAIGLLPVGSAAASGSTPTAHVVNTGDNTVTPINTATHTARTPMAVAGAASGPALPSPGWSRQPSSNPPGATSSYLNAVSCSSPSSCTAVGYQYHPYEQNLAETWNGTSWSVEPSSNPPGATSSYLSAVSCPSASFCMAVGYQYHPYEQNAGRDLERHQLVGGAVVERGDQQLPELGVVQLVQLVHRGGLPVYEQNLAETWNGTSWSVEPSSNPPGATSSYLNSVSCSSPSSCTAVGYQYHPYEQNLAETWNGTSWSVEPSSNPPGATSSYLNAVSCPSASFCMAVGYQYHPYEQNLAETWNANSTPPSVTNVSPNSGPAAGGTAVTITGTGFAGASAVRFDATAATNVTVNSAIQITAYSPAGTAGSTVDVTVVGPGGTSATGSADKYAYVSAGPPETLAVATGGTGSGSVTGAGISCPGTCTASYSQGTIVTLTAVAASGSTFGGWSGACGGSGACTITMSAAESVAAAFTKIVTPGQADLATTLAGTGIAAVGGYMGYTITVTNNGPDPASNVVVTDPTPAGLRPSTLYCVGSVPPPGSGEGWCGPLPANLHCSTPSAGSPGTVTCTPTSSLKAGASVTVIMAIRVGLYFHNQLICDTATATSSTTDPNTPNNTATVCARVN